MVRLRSRRIRAGGLVRLQFSSRPDDNVHDTEK